jgi:diguanylate cyclase (GGDEF)-like protein
MNTELPDSTTFEYLVDPLTGLLSSQGLRAVLIGLDGVATSDYALIRIDIDAFAKFNCEFSHKTGDALLRAIATRIKTREYTETLVARTGGDEITLAIEWPGDIVAKEQGIEVLRLFDSPFLVQNRKHQISACVGVARLLRGERFEVGERRCASAILQAKLSGRFQVQCYDPTWAPQ